MSKEELIELEERFQPHLLNSDYTFIGPDDPKLLEPFMDIANDLAPVVSISRSYNDFLSDKKATRQALASLPPKTPLRIFVITRTSGRHDSFLLHSTVDGYCQRHNINFQP